MKGFTLIELLIVIVLIGVISTMALLSMGFGDQQNWQRWEAERLLHLFELASQESVVKNAPVAVELFSSGYRFMSTDHDQWQIDEKDDLFKPRELQAQITLGLLLDKKSIHLKKNNKSLEAPEPQIIFTPDGGLGLFQVRVLLAESDAIYTIENTAENGLLMVRETHFVGAGL
jgi:general secretion pathway protein H